MLSGHWVSIIVPFAWCPWDWNLDPQVWDHHHHYSKTAPFSWSLLKPTMTKYLSRLLSSPIPISGRTRLELEIVDRRCSKQDVFKRRVHQKKWENSYFMTWLTIRTIYFLKVQSNHNPLTHWPLTNHPERPPRPTWPTQNPPDLIISSLYDIIRYAKYIFSESSWHPLSTDPLTIQPLTR